MIGWVFHCLILCYSFLFIFFTCLHTEIYIRGQVKEEKSDKRKKNVSDQHSLVIYIQRYSFKIYFPSLIIFKLYWPYFATSLTLFIYL